MDDYSRAICGYTVFTGAPSALNTALALRQAIWRKQNPFWVMCGLPDILHVDHGSDFTSHHLERPPSRCISGPSIPPSAGLKAAENRAFLRNDQHRSPRRAARALGPETRAPQPMLDLPALDGEIGAFIATYNDRAHASSALTPGPWVADGWLPRMPDTLEELDGLLLTVPKNRVVQRDGIHFQGQRYLSPTLAPFVGRTITIRYDPRDISEIRVFDHETFICTAIDEDHQISG